MIKFFTLLCTSLLIIIQIGYAQIDPVLGRAGSFSVLASTEVNNTGTTSIAGNLGIHPGNTINDQGILVLSGTPELGTASAANAQADAEQAYNTLVARPATKTLTSATGTIEIGNREVLRPGVYKIDGNASLKNILILNGMGNLNSQFVFIIDGNFSSASPASPTTPSAGVLPIEGAQAKNIFWVVKGSADIGISTLLMGTILAQQSVTLQTGASLIGNAISLNSSVNLNSNTVYYTSIIYANLGITKVAEPSEGGYTVGGEVTYVITARNSGESSGTATNVRVREQFPSTLGFLGATPSKGTYNEETNEWLVGNLDAEESATLTITFRILAPGNLVNNVVINSDTPDPDPDNDEDEDPIQAVCTPPALTITGDAALCPGVASLNYTVTAVEGATYSYEVTGGLAILSQSENTIEIGPGTSVTGGAVTVTVTDKCGDTYTATQNIGLLSAPPDTPTINGPATLCANTEATYTATGVNDDNTFNWTVTGGLEIVSSDGNTVLVRAGSAGGTLRVTASNSCLLTSQPATRTITTTSPLAAIGTVTGPAAVCSNSDAIYSVPVLAADATYNWSYSGNWQVLGEETVDNRRRIRVRFGPSATSGTLTLTASNACGSTSAAPVAVTVSPGAPTAPGAITAGGGACIGEQLTYSISAVNNATSYEWRVTGTGWAINGDNTGTSVTATAGSGAGVVSVRAVNGCGESSYTILNVSASESLGTVGAISGPATSCAGTTGLQYSISAVARASTYNWSVPAGWTITAGQGTNSITVTAGAGNGAVSVAVANACGAGQATLNVSSVPPVAAESIADNSDICKGLTYSVSPVTGASSYTWSVPNGFTILSGQGTTTIQVRADSPNAFGDVTLVTSNGVCDGPVVRTAIDLARVDGALDFPKAFSPNGDGINDNWVVSNITKYPNQVTLFNRWGSEVYRKTNYQNDWNGNGLEAGTYFYKVSVRQCDNTNREYTGYVMIFR